MIERVQEQGESAGKAVADEQKDVLTASTSQNGSVYMPDGSAAVIDDIAQSSQA